jgi:hypothetical protein
VIKRLSVHDSIDEAVRDELGKLAPGMAFG